MYPQKLSQSLLDRIVNALQIMKEAERTSILNSNAWLPEMNRLLFYDLAIEDRIQILECLNR